MNDFHKTKDGTRMLIKDMSANHIRNTIRLIERKAENGFYIRCGGGSCPDDFWYDEQFIQDEEALDYLNHQSFVQEMKRRLKSV